MDFVISPSGAPGDLPWTFLLFANLLAFFLSQIIAITYKKTYQGMSYSRSLVHALALLGILSCTLMFSIGNSLARGLGIAGIFAVIRFRTNLRDPRDIVFVFASLAAGISCGIKAFPLAISSTVLFCFAVTYLRYVPLGDQSYFDGLLRFQMEPDEQKAREIQDLLRKSCQTFALITLREVAQGKTLEYAYQVKLWDGKHKDPLVYALQNIADVHNVSLFFQENTVEL